MEFLALDLGAESGRGIIGSISDDRLVLDVASRFLTGSTQVRGSLFLDVLRIFDEIKNSISASNKRVDKLAGIGIDAWGVDFGLLGQDDALLGNPYHYRDSRTDGMMEEALKLVSADEIFDATGVQFMQINTIFQLFAMVKERSPLIDAAETMLTIPNLFNFWLSGVKTTEFTHATTTQCYDPRAQDWARGIMEKLGIPTKILTDICSPGTTLGPILPEVAEETGAAGTPIIAVGCHDTASAVVAVPAADDDYAYISSGTWSLMGVESSKPIISDAVKKANFTNEGGIGGTFRFLKNIMGLWLVQECRRTWAREGDEMSYQEIADAAASAKPFKCIIDPNHSSFLPPGDMPARIRAYAESTGQPAPETKGEVARTAMEGLAFKYRQTLDTLEKLTGRSLRTIHIVGGGGQNKLLCQFTADATGREVIAGPNEATAAGNILVQAIATGLIDSISNARRIVRNSFELDRYEPQDAARWSDIYERFLEIAE